MITSARIRSWIARHQRTYWALVGGAALGAMALVHSQQAEADAARRQWTDTIVVWVAAAETDSGEAIDARAVSLPMAGVPEGALGSDPTDRIAVRDLHRNQVISDLDVDAGVLTVSLVDARAVTIGLDQRGTSVQPGQFVDVVADGIVVATGGVVIEQTPEAVTVAVNAADAALAASAAHDGRAELVARLP